MDVLKFAKVYSVLEAFAHFKDLASSLTSEEVALLERIGNEEVKQYGKL